MSLLFFAEGAGVIALAFVLWKRGTFKRTAKSVPKAVPVGRGHMWYVAGEKKGHTVVLLHDFAADRSQWSALMPLLTAAGYHVVVPDLPGFGDNLRDIDGKYDAPTMAKQLRAFVRGADLGMFHLVGAGTGAVVAASYAYGMPTELASVTLIEPLGLTSPGESDFDKMVAKSRNPLLPATPQAYDHLLGFVTATPPAMSAAAKKKAAETLAVNREFYTRVWSELCEGDRAHLIDLLLPEVKVRTLLLFGGKSRIVHPSTAKVVEKRLEGRDVKVQVLPDVGHWPMVENPKALCEALVGFFRSAAADRQAKAKAKAEAKAKADGESGGQGAGGGGEKDGAARPPAQPKAPAPT